MISLKYTYSFCIRASITLLFLWLASPTKGQKTYTEYELKAGYLVNFSKFVQWPNNHSTFSIGIIGKNPFGNILEEMTKQVIEKGEEWTIEQYGSLNDIKPCNVLFISKDQIRQLPDLIQAVNGKAILTVADGIPGFCETGGMINLTDGKNGRPFEICLEALKAECLTVDMELLRLATLKEVSKTLKGPCSKN